VKGQCTGTEQPRRSETHTSRARNLSHQVSSFTAQPTKWLPPRSRLTSRCMYIHDFLPTDARVKSADGRGLSTAGVAAGSTSSILPVPQFCLRRRRTHSIEQWGIEDGVLGLKNFFSLKCIRRTTCAQFSRLIEVLSLGTMPLRKHWSRSSIN